jgi:hypothetical protein
MGGFRTTLEHMKTSPVISSVNEAAAPYAFPSSIMLSTFSGGRDILALSPLILTQRTNLRFVLLFYKRKFTGHWGEISTTSNEEDDQGNLRSIAIMPFFRTSASTYMMF